MSQFRAQGFVGSDSLAFIPAGRRFFLAGQIACQGMIVIDVLKELEWLNEVLGVPQVQTIMYSYNVAVRNVGIVFRYDNQHSGHLHLGHADAHHKHIYDWPNPGQTPESPIAIGADGWPTLGEVIEESRCWLADHYEQVPSPDSFVTSLHYGIRF